MNEVESSTEITHKRLLVSGKVQGVWYRQSTMEQAQALNLSGWVRNLPDGRVEIEVHGPANRVQTLIDWCHNGPPAAQVLEVLVDELGRPGEIPDGFYVTR